MLSWAACFQFAQQHLVPVPSVPWTLVQTLSRLHDFQLPSSESQGLLILTEKPRQWHQGELTYMWVKSWGISSHILK